MVIIECKSAHESARPDPTFDLRSLRSKVGNERKRSPGHISAIWITLFLLVYYPLLTLWCHCDIRNKPLNSKVGYKQMVKPVCCSVSGAL